MTDPFGDLLTPEAETYHDRWDREILASRKAATMKQAPLTTGGRAALDALVLVCDDPSLTVTCPTCGQPPVKPCLYESGDKAGMVKQTSHGPRRTLFLTDYIERWMPR